MPADPHRLGLKVKLARYHLQFCAVNSQLSQHNDALVSVVKAHPLMGQCDRWVCRSVAPFLSR